MRFRNAAILGKKYHDRNVAFCRATNCRTPAVRQFAVETHIRATEQYLHRSALALPIDFVNNGDNLKEPLIHA